MALDNNYGLSCCSSSSSCRHHHLHKHQRSYWSLGPSLHMQSTAHNRDEVLNNTQVLTHSQSAGNSYWLPRPSSSHLQQHEHNTDIPQSDLYAPPGIQSSQVWPDSIPTQIPLKPHSNPDRPTRTSVAHWALDFRIFYITISRHFCQSSWRLIIPSGLPSITLWSNQIHTSVYQSINYLRKQVVALLCQNALFSGMLCSYVGLRT